MPAPSYLLKSRHGIYYFRIRVAGFVRHLTHKSAGEIRVSLNTRDKTVALYLSRRLWIAMKEKSLANTSIELEAWDLEADIERQRYFQGSRPYLSPLTKRHERWIPDQSCGGPARAVGQCCAPATFSEEKARIVRFRCGLRLPYQQIRCDWCGGFDSSRRIGGDDGDEGG